MNVKSLSFSRGAFRRLAYGGLLLTALCIGISAVWADASYPLDPDGGISPGWNGPTLPEIPELLDPPALPEVPALPTTALPSYPHDEDADGYTQTDAAHAGHAACDPFQGLYGRNVLAHLEGDQVISGFLMDVCDGYIVLQQLHVRRTFVVNAAKVLYLEQTEVY